MKFTEMYKQAVDEGRTEQISIEIKRWDVEGETLVGRILSREQKASNTYEGEYTQYLLQTDEGMVSTIFGAGVDLLFKTQNPVGNVYAFVYRGKRKLDGGRTMNHFEVHLIGEHGGRE